MLKSKPRQRSTANGTADGYNGGEGDAGGCRPTRPGIPQLAAESVDTEAEADEREAALLREARELFRAPVLDLRMMSATGLATGPSRDRGGALAQLVVDEIGAARARGDDRQRGAWLTDVEPSKKRLIAELGSQACRWPRSCARFELTKTVATCLVRDGRRADGSVRGIDDVY